jgi:hypothetical protein
MQLLRYVLCGGEEEERRRVAECKRRGQRCQSEGANQCLHHDAVIADVGCCAVLVVMFTIWSFGVAAMPVTLDYPTIHRSL